MIIEPPIDNLLGKVDSKYTLCILSARRARQINDMLRGVRDQALLSVSSTKISEYTSVKPLTKALDEIAIDDVGYERPE